MWCRGAQCLGDVLRLECTYVGADVAEVWSAPDYGTAPSERFVMQGAAGATNGAQLRWYDVWFAVDLRLYVSDLLERWRNKRVMFVSDSPGLNQYDSLLCVLYAAVLANPAPPSLPMGLLESYFRRMKQIHPQVQISHVRRQANQVAHSIAAHGRSGGFQVEGPYDASTLSSATLDLIRFERSV